MGDGAVWHTMGRVKGAVRSIASSYEKIFIAGDFTEIDSRPVAYVAFFDNGAWRMPAAVVNGPVLSIKFVNSCMYLGGSFTAVTLRDPPSWIDSSASFAARYCFDATEDRFGSYEGIDSFDGIGDVNVIALAFES